MNKDSLISTCARICYYAQEHFRERTTDEQLQIGMYCFKATSYTIACFISQLPGYEDVEWDIVLDDLTSETKGLQEWEQIISRLVEVYT